jgi:hypothetical protein
MMRSTAARRRTLRRRGGRLALAVALGAAVIAVAATQAVAQVAAAIGKPLQSPDLAVGLVTVKVVAGTASAPVVSTDVTLVVNEVPRQARTDSAGRASFPGLPPGATAIARVFDADKQPHESEKFTIPSAGGTRILLTTKPWQASAGGGAPFAGGGAGMPNPRKLSGEPRGEQGDPSGQLTVRVTYDDFQDTPEGVPVALVGYAADDSTSYQTQNTDRAGRVQFHDLDRSGGTAYFALTQLPRDTGTDRLTSIPVLFDTQVGVRMVLSGEKRSSQAPGIDDFAKADAQVVTPAGKVRVVLEGTGDISGKIALVDAATRKPLGEAAPQLAPPDTSRVQSASEFLPDTKLPAGTLEILVVGGTGPSNEPLKDIEVRVIPAASSDTGSGPAQVTGADGRLHMLLQVSEPQKAVFTINGRPQISKTFDISRAGGKLLLGARWEDFGRPEAMLDAAPARTVYAEYSVGAQRYRSMPFQTLEKTGSKVTVYAVPRIQFQFQLESDVEDELLAVRGRFVVVNNSWAPYRAGPDGMVIALPRGFKGAVVADTDQNEVSVAQGEGFRIIRPIPPEGRQFHAGLSLPVERGTVHWQLDLPMGAFGSSLAVKQVPGMTVHTPPGTESETRPTPQGPYTLVGPFSIAANQSMVMTVEGLPSRPAWRWWLQLIVGLLVVAVMLGGVVLALLARRQPQVESGKPDARRQQLLDELVELERSTGDPRRREQLLEELERLWG